MTNLSERVMSLSGPDREVDAEIAQQFGFIPPDYERAVEHGEVRLFWWHKTDDHEPYWVPPAFTASIDAAMTLVPETWAVGSLDWWPERRVSGVTLFEVKHFEGDGYSRVGYDAACCKKAVSSAATPALALCAAALIAREASNAE